MKRLLIISFGSFFIPFYIFIALMNSYLPRVYYTGILAHSILVAIICSTAFSICYFYYRNYAQNKNLTFFAVALFFEIIGILMFFHAISIPTFYFLSEGLFDITEHFGFFLSGLVLMLLFLPMGLIDNFLYNHRKRILIFSALILIVWFGSLLVFDGLCDKFVEYIDQITYLSGGLLVLGIAALFKERRLMAEYISFPYLVAGLSILLSVAIVPFFYKEWNVVWWYFHIIIFATEAVIFIGILKKCDKKTF